MINVNSQLVLYQYFGTNIQYQSPRFNLPMVVSVPRKCTLPHTPRSPGESADRNLWPDGGPLEHTNEPFHLHEIATKIVQGAPIERNAGFDPPAPRPRHEIGALDLKGPLAV